GIFISDASNNTIGGPAESSRNVISGNEGDGISIILSSASLSTTNLIEGNFIGTASDGATDLGHTGDGLFISNFGATNGPSLIVSNIIAFNGSDGVWVFSGERNAIRSNSIFSNGLLGINLGDVFATANDPGDSDAGANQLQNFPVITTAVSSATDIAIS